MAKIELNPNYAMELTPDGLDQHEPGAKVDAGKPMCDVVVGGFPRAMLEVSKVGTFGATKYTPDGWKEVADGQRRYTDAMLRHYFKSKFEDNDPDSELLHLAHMAWNALALLELNIKDKEEEELPKSLRNIQL